MAYIYSLTILFLAFFLQTSFLGNMRILYLIPNLVLILLIIFSFSRSVKEVTTFAFIFGLLMDLLFGFFFGFHLLFFLFLVLFTNIFSKEGKSASLIRVLGVTFMASIVYSIFLGINLYISEVSLNFGNVALLLGQVFINLLFCFILFSMLVNYFHFLKTNENHAKQRVRL